MVLRKRPCPICKAKLSLLSSYLGPRDLHPACQPYVPFLLSLEKPGQVWYSSVGLRVQLGCGVVHWGSSVVGDETRWAVAEIG